MTFNTEKPPGTPGSKGSAVQKQYKKFWIRLRQLWSRGLKLWKNMVGTWGLEPQTSTVSKSSPEGQSILRITVMSLNLLVGFRLCLDPTGDANIE